MTGDDEGTKIQLVAGIKAIKPDKSTGNPFRNEDVLNPRWWAGSTQDWTPFSIGRRLDRIAREKRLERWAL